MNLGSDPFAALSRPSSGAGREASVPPRQPSSLNPFAPRFQPAMDHQNREHRNPGSTPPPWRGGGQVPPSPSLSVGTGPTSSTGPFTGISARGPQPWGSPIPRSFRPNESEMMEASDDHELGGTSTFGGRPRANVTFPSQHDSAAQTGFRGSSVHGRGGPTIQCRVCQRSFPSYPELKQHIRDENHYESSRHTATKDADYADGGNRPSVNTVVENRYPQSFACRVCKTSFPTFQEMKQHIKAENHYAPTKETTVHEDGNADNDTPEGRGDDENQGHRIN